MRTQQRSAGRVLIRAPRRPVEVRLRYCEGHSCTDPSARRRLVNPVASVLYSLRLLTPFRFHTFSSLVLKFPLPCFYGFTLHGQALRTMLGFRSKGMSLEQVDIRFRNPNLAETDCRERKRRRISVRCSLWVNIPRLPIVPQVAHWSECMIRCSLSKNKLSRGQFINSISRMVYHPEDNAKYSSVNFPNCSSPNTKEANHDWR